jgi:CTP synthase
MTKYVFVTGGVVSSIGKGIATACLGTLLKARGLKISIQKIDPYLNVDAGTMNPHQHGEVFVTEDGAETDLDLGHYERFVDQDLGPLSNMTTGAVYRSVIERERRGDYLGNTVQVIPHITDEIKDRIRANALENDADVAIIEIGGTIGDIESLPFTEAIRQMKMDEGFDNVMYVHVTLVPFVGPKNEMKTKPTQHSVRELRNIGITPDILICRTKMPLLDEMKLKIAMFCDITPDSIIEGLDAEHIYHLPTTFERQGFASRVLKRLGLPDETPHLEKWEKIERTLSAPQHFLKVAICGKYMEHAAQPDTYISVVESIEHGALANEAQAEIKWINSEDKAGIAEELADCDALIIPGGFGERGVEGKIEAIRFARENGLPFLGLCLGLQTAVIEYARNVAGLGGAHSTEFNPDTPFPVVAMLKEQRSIDQKGGTMRLGADPCSIKPGTLAERLYGESLILERHRHRFEVNPRFHRALEAAGLVFSGTSPDKRLAEIIELSDHPYFIASQFHPEFKSRPTRAHPLFSGLIEAGLKRQSEREKAEQNGHTPREISELRRSIA